MNATPQNDHFSKRAQDYDRLQPVRLEMYRFYHQLALDFIPFDTQDTFRLLDLGCGTGTFLNDILDHYPNATCVATDYSNEMLKFATQKTSAHSNRVTFYQGDLNKGLPNDLGPFQLVASFSALHHLTDKTRYISSNKFMKCSKKGDGSSSLMPCPYILITMFSIWAESDRNINDKKD